METFQSVRAMIDLFENKGRLYEETQFSKPISKYFTSSPELRITQHQREEVLLRIKNFNEKLIKYDEYCKETHLKLQNELIEIFEEIFIDVVNIAVYRRKELMNIFKNQIEQLNERLPSECSENHFSYKHFPLTDTEEMMDTFQSNNNTHEATFFNMTELLTNPEELDAISTESKETESVDQPSKVDILKRFYELKSLERGKRKPNTSFHAENEQRDAFWSYVRHLDRTRNGNVHEESVSENENLEQVADQEHDDEIEWENTQVAPEENLEEEYSQDEDDIPVQKVFEKEAPSSIGTEASQENLDVNTSESSEHSDYIDPID